MPDQQPHTPTTEEVRLAHAESVTFHQMEEPELTEANSMFDRFLAERDARISAAAEQRGAIEALRDVAESNDLIGHMYREYDDHPLRSTLAPAAVRATSNYLHNQANQMEGDE